MFCNLYMLLNEMIFVNLKLIHVQRHNIMYNLIDQCANCTIFDYYTV